MYLDGDKDGPVFIKIIRGYERDSMKSPCKIIAISAHEQFRQAALDAGADMFLVKPFKYETIRDILTERTG